MPRGALRLGSAVLVLALAACGDRRDANTVRLWAFGREGEVVKELVPEFERRHPGLRLDVQQVPWTAAHEKLLTAFVGDATPDVSQLGNTWIPEFVALGALEPLDRLVGASAVVRRPDYFEGIWATNMLGDTTFGVPWYVDTRVLFYRRDLLAAAGHDSVPTTWAGWRQAMTDVKARMQPRHRVSARRYSGNTASSLISDVRM